MADIRLDQLAAEIARAVKEYTEDVAEAVEKKVDEVADKVLVELEATAPKHTGDYAKNFKKSKQGQGDKTKRAIWNKKHYRRVHLLEFGRAKRNGGRVAGRPHLRPAYDKHAAGLPDDIKRIIRNGGGT